MASGDSASITHSGGVRPASHSIYWRGHYYFHRLAEVTVDASVRSSLKQRILTEHEYTEPLFECSLANDECLQTITCSFRPSSLCCNTITGLIAASPTLHHFNAIDDTPICCCCTVLLIYYFLCSPSHTDLCR